MVIAFLPGGFAGQEPGAVIASVVANSSWIDCRSGIDDLQEDIVQTWAKPGMLSRIFCAVASSDTPWKS